MENSRKQELFPYFAYLYSQQMNPEKYGSVNSIDEWIGLIQDSEDDAKAIAQAAEQLSDEDWISLEEKYKSAQDKGIEFAAKGTKLKKLKSSTKKCKCGCDLVTVKEKGGKVVSKCSCGCKPRTKKAQKGMLIQGPKLQVNGIVNKPSAKIEDKSDSLLTRTIKQIVPAPDQIQMPGKNFKEAFATARASGLKTFMWNGKSFTTQLAEEVSPKQSNSVAKPAPAKTPAAPAKIPTFNGGTLPPATITAEAPKKNQPSSLAEYVDRMNKARGIDPTKSQSKPLQEKKNNSWVWDILLQPKLTIK